MRLFLFIGNLGTGGAERVAVNLANAFVQKGHHVTLATLSDKDRDAYQVSPDVVRLAFGMAGRNRGPAKLWALVARIRALRNAIRRDRPDTVLAMMTQESIMTIIACAGLPVRVVVSERSAFWMRPRPWLWAWLFRWLYRYSDTQVVQTKEIARRVARETGARSLVVVPNSVVVPVEGYGATIRPETVVSADAKVILLIGSKPYTKGFDDALLAFQALARHQNGWQLVFLGLPDGHDWARQMSSAPDAAGRVNVIPPVANVQDWYDRAAIFVLSSRTEGMPNALMEAMASGCACIAYDCPTGPADLIENGVNGRLVEAGSLNQLTDALISMAHDKKLRNRLGNAARFIAQRHAPEIVLSAWEQVLFPSQYRLKGQNKRT
ncbi:Glycosyltransferase involved in cell wall bisynthesis [Sulfitobacter litoralis]|uniref:Glycosyltransferase involved in cell wall bisynthesis n=1 Tax=Sulfitobacter litoralis TaxID=335975 RepID=A0ABY0SUG5_9RHOB|nr:glycosyltransferase [Sulfitobacter litoralis]SDP62255.1 Glycosyltransferase involved in cell wall bisynthesis [Sulfitobacter litoralis]